MGLSALGGSVQACRSSDPPILNFYYVGVFGDLYKKQNSQENWELINESLVDEDDYGFVDQLLLLQDNKNILFAKTDYSSLYKSQDAGNTWVKINSIGHDQGDFNKLTYDPVNKFIYIATSTGLYVSKNLGDSFEKVMGIKSKSNENSLGVTEVAVSKFNPEQIYIVVNEKLYRSG